LVSLKWQCRTDAAFYSHARHQNELSTAKRRKCGCARRGWAVFAVLKTVQF
jgi:hypothetical protein